MPFQSYLRQNKSPYRAEWIKDQTARSVQSDLDLHGPQKPVSRVWKTKC